MPTFSPVDVPPILCLHLERATERGRRMERRFAHHGLTERVHWVASVPIAEEGMWEGDWTDRASQACFASHIKAMRQALELPEVRESGAVICEDDCLFHNEFVSRLSGVLANLPDTTPVCALGSIVDDWERMRWAGTEPSKHNLCALEWG